MIRYKSVKSIRLVSILSMLATVSCTSPLMKTSSETITDTTSFTITVNAVKGNGGLDGFEGPVFVHVGLITDSSEHPNDWRHKKFIWGSDEAGAKATSDGKNKWSYPVPGIRKFFAVPAQEKVSAMMILFREGNCIDTFCRVLRNEDGSDMRIEIK